jgi:hypothetical protein
MIKPDINELTVLRSAILTWGETDQFNMAFGECGEFVALCGRRAQGRATKEDFRSEIADVIIMMAQMREIFGPEKVDAMINFKIDRLKQKLLNHHNKEKA